MLDTLFSGRMNGVNSVNGENMNEPIATRHACVYPRIYADLSSPLPRGAGYPGEDPRERGVLLE